MVIPYYLPAFQRRSVSGISLSLLDFGTSVPIRLSQEHVYRIIRGSSAHADKLFVPRTVTSTQLAAYTIGGAGFEPASVI